MTSYFDEHNCEPLANGQSPNHMLHMARLLLDSGVGAQLQMEFSRMFPRGKPPAASKTVVDNLPRLTGIERQQCPVCIAEFDKAEQVIRMPCNHIFHPTCILQWLTATNSCPLCRHELKTNDVDYEEYKRQLVLEKSKEENLQQLHDSMFS